MMRKLRGKSLNVRMIKNYQLKMLYDTVEVEAKKTSIGNSREVIERR